MTQRCPLSTPRRRCRRHEGGAALGLRPAPDLRGGRLGRGFRTISTTELYDPQNASWTQRAGMAVTRYLHGCVALHGKLYAVGGFGTTNQALDTAEVYDLQTDGWQPLAKMSTGRS